LLLAAHQSFHLLATELCPPFFTGREDNHQFSSPAAIPWSLAQAAPSHFLCLFKEPNHSIIKHQFQTNTKALPVPKHHKSTKLPLPAPITMAVAHTNHQAPSIINQICNLKVEKQTSAQPLNLQITNQSLTATILISQFTDMAIQSTINTISNYPSPITISNLPLHQKEPIHHFITQSSREEKE
jgi:hypothetical protein